MEVAAVDRASLGEKLRVSRAYGLSIGKGLGTYLRPLSYIFIILHVFASKTLVSHRVMLQWDFDSIDSQCVFAIPVGQIWHPVLPRLTKVLPL
jgi:hypothetical protein